MSEGRRAPGLSLRPEARAECSHLMSAAHPKEACALLIGKKTEREHRVERVLPIPNIAEGSNTYQLDPLAWRAAELRARAADLEVLGVWHSHPRTPATPSPKDRAGAQPGWSHAISSGTAPERLRSYFCFEEELVEQRVTSLP